MYNEYTICVFDACGPVTGKIMCHNQVSFGHHAHHIIYQMILKLQPYMPISHVGHILCDFITVYYFIGVYWLCGFGVTHKYYFVSLTALQIHNGIHISHDAVGPYQYTTTSMNNSFQSVFPTVSKIVFNSS